MLPFTTPLKNKKKKKEKKDYHFPGWPCTAACLHHILPKAYFSMGLAVLGYGERVLTTISLMSALLPFL